MLNITSRHHYEHTHKVKRNIMAWTWNPLLVRWGSICLWNSRFAHGKIARAPRQQQHVANIFLQRDDGLLARSESARFDSKYFSRIERFEEPSGGDFQHDLDEHFLTFLCFVFLLGRDTLEKILKCFVIKEPNEMLGKLLYWELLADLPSIRFE